MNQDLGGLDGLCAKLLISDVSMLVHFILGSMRDCIHSLHHLFIIYSVR